MRLDERIVALRTEREHKVELMVQQTIYEFCHWLVDYVEEDIWIELHEILQRFVNHHIKRMGDADVEGATLQRLHIVHAA